MRIEQGVIPRVYYHTKRIRSSSAALGFLFNETAWESKLSSIQDTYNQGIYRLKIELSKDGTFEIKVEPLMYKPYFTAKLQSIDNATETSLLINKTSQRQHLTHNHTTDLILLYNEYKILEFDIGNIMIEEQGKYYTPSYQHDFLPGCKRQEMIDQGKLFEKDYTVDMLKEGLQKQEIKIYLINSLREVADVSIYL